jgi:hypothetical protein
MNLSPAQLERLAILAEECSEVQQIAMKIIRHGYNNYHPNSTGLDNRDLLEKELGDLRNALRMMIAAKDVEEIFIDQSARKKRETIQQYLRYQPDDVL